MNDIIVRKEKPFPVLNRDEIKYFAMFAMLLNHIACIFLQAGTVLAEICLDIGYFTGVTFCYFMVEGYQYTRSKRNYGLWLLIFAILSQFPFQYALGSEGYSMMYTLFVCFLVLVVREKMTNKALCVIAEILLVFASINGDWPLIAPVLVILFDKCRKGEFSFTAAYLLAAAGLGSLKYLDYSTRFPLAQALLYTAGACLGIALSYIVIRFFYNGKRAKHGKTVSKWFFYCFYPAHLLILGILARTM